MHASLTSLLAGPTWLGKAQTHLVVSCLHMALDCCPWVLIVLRLACASLGAMLFEIYKSQSVSPWQAGALVCTAWAVAPVCCMSVCVAACSAARIARAAAPVRAASAGGRSLYARPCACSTNVHSVSSIIGIDYKMRNYECPQAKGVAGVSPQQCFLAPNCELCKRETYRSKNRMGPVT